MTNEVAGAQRVGVAQGERADALAGQRDRERWADRAESKARHVLALKSLEIAHTLKASEELLVGDDVQLAGARTVQPLPTSDIAFLEDTPSRSNRSSLRPSAWVRVPARKVARPTRGPPRRRGRARSARRRGTHHPCQTSRTSPDTRCAPDSPLKPRAMGYLPAQIADVTRHQDRRTLDGYIQAGQWFASDSTPQIRGLIRPHLAGSSARRGGAGHERARSTQRGPSS